MKKKVLLLYIFIVSIIASLCHLEISVLSDHVISVEFLLTYVMMLVVIWNYSCKRIDLYFLFSLTFGLFIGGSLIACSFLPELDPFQTTFFYSYNVSYIRKKEIIWFVEGFMLFSTLGYAWRKGVKCRHLITPKEPLYFKRWINGFMSCVFPVILIVQIFYSVFFLREAMAGGYLEHFLSSQNGEYTGTSFAGILKLFIYMLMGLSLAYGDRKNQKMFIILFLIHSVTDLLVGSRSAFGVILLVLLWIYSENHKIELKKFFILLCAALAVMLTIFSFSVRAATSGFGELSVTEMISGFIYSTGGSLMIFDTSRFVEDYPTLAYLQCFIPGVSRLYSLFSSTSLNPWDVSFTAHMCYSLNPGRYLDGEGLAWTLLSDLYLFSGRQFIVYLLLSYGWGWFICSIEIWSEKAVFYRYMKFFMASAVLLIPRNSISGIFPLIVYIVVFWLILRFISTIKNNNLKNIYR